MNRDRTDGSAFDPTTVGEMHSGQVRMAYRLAAQYRGELLYSYRDGTGNGWLSWDGSWWTNDDSGAPTRAVLDVLRRSLDGSRNGDRLRSDVAACESAAGVAGVLDLAAALETFAITGAELDAIRAKIMAPAALAACVQRVLDAHPVDREQALHYETLNAINTGSDPVEVFDVMFRIAREECLRVNEPRLIIDAAIKEATADVEPWLAQLIGDEFDEAESPPRATTH